LDRWESRLSLSRSIPKPAEFALRQRVKVVADRPAIPTEQDKAKGRRVSGPTPLFCLL
jgi:hypothetical protein